VRLGDHQLRQIQSLAPEETELVGVSRDRTHLCKSLIRGGIVEDHEVLCFALFLPGPYLNDLVIRDLKLAGVADVEDQDFLRLHGFPNVHQMIVQGHRTHDFAFEGANLAHALQKLVVRFD